MNSPALTPVAANMNFSGFNDGLVNFVSRMGVAGDKSAYAQYAVFGLALFDLEAAYRTTWFRKICDIPSFDEVRAWRQWTGAGKDQITLIDKEEKRLGLQQKIAEARILARKDGGSAVVLGFDDGDASKPYDVARVGQGGLKFVNVLNRTQIRPGEFVSDPLNPYHGGSEFYFAGPNLRPIHASRVIKFIGNPMRDPNMGGWDGWGESIWVEIRDRVKQSDQIAASIASMVDEAKVDVMKIKGLMSGLATAEYENILVQRMGLMNTLKSNNNALLLDADDEYVQITNSFAGLSDLQDRAMTLLAGAADIPATRLFGRAPQGMNATGDGDMRNYYDRIAAGQVMYLQPALTSLDEALIRSSLGARPAEIYYTWNPLYSLNETEAAAVEKQFADTAKIYADAGLIPGTALAAIVRDGIVERGQFPGADDAFKASDAEGELPDLLAEPTEAELAEEAARVAVATETARNPAPPGKERSL